MLHRQLTMLSIVQVASPQRVMAQVKLQIAVAMGTVLLVALEQWTLGSRWWPRAAVRLGTCWNPKIGGFIWLILVIHW